MNVFTTIQHDCYLRMFKAKGKVQVGWYSLRHEAFCAMLTKVKCPNSYRDYLIPIFISKMKVQVGWYSSNSDTFCNMVAKIKYPGSYMEYAVPVYIEV